MCGGEANGNFFEKNENFWQFKKKKCQVFGNFLTFKWQFSGELDSHLCQNGYTPASGS